MVLVSQLREKAREMKIKGYSKMKKAELETALGIPRPSAYRSMRLSKLGLTKPSKETESRLKNWTASNWQNLTAKFTDNQNLPCGKKGKKQQELQLPSICRPTIQINKNTPSLASNFTNAQIKKAIKMKKQGKRIEWKKL